MACTVHGRLDHGCFRFIPRQNGGDRRGRQISPTFVPVFQLIAIEREFLSLGANVGLGHSAQHNNEFYNTAFFLPESQ